MALVCSWHTSYHPIFNNFPACIQTSIALSYSNLFQCFVFWLFSRTIARVTFPIGQARFVLAKNPLEIRLNAGIINRCLSVLVSPADLLLFA